MISLIAAGTASYSSLILRSFLTQYSRRKGPHLRLAGMTLRHRHVHLIYPTFGICRCCTQGLRGLTKFLSSPSVPCGAFASISIFSLSPAYRRIFWRLFYLFSLRLINSRRLGKSKAPSEKLSPCCWHVLV